MNLNSDQSRTRQLRRLLMLKMPRSRLLRMPRMLLMLLTRRRMLVNLMAKLGPPTCQKSTLRKLLEHSNMLTFTRDTDLKKSANNSLNNYLRIR